MSGADTMDQQKLRTLVFEKTGIKIDATDPVFALVALNESVLEETLQRHWAMVREQSPGQWHGSTSTATLQQSGTRQPAYKAAGDNFEAEEEPQAMPGTLDDGSDASARTSAQEQAPAPASISQNGAISNAPATLWDTRLLWLALATSLITTVLVLAGQVWLQGKPAPEAINSEQKARLLQAEKLGKAIEKLDPKAKAQLQAELNKL